MKYKIIGAVGLSILALAGCMQQNADEIQNNKQNAQNMQAINSVGFPAIIHFFEKRMMKTIMEMRDDPTLATYSYIKDQNGGYRWFCDSVGYGLPGAVQYTNPQYLYNPTNAPGYYVMPQADPNGLYSPATMDATWILCKVPEKDNKIEPQYVEDKLIVSTYRRKDAIGDPNLK